MRGTEVMRLGLLLLAFGLFSGSARRAPDRSRMTDASGAERTPL